ncbi:MAG: HD domain-containing protein [Amoebophilaceae bacterium]|nr:HD domain-containing protein [Amoebophilaceae bacterium]
MSINPVLTAVLIFFLVSLIVGLWDVKKTKTFQQFAVGDRKFSTPTLVATIVATNFGGGFLFRDLEQIYTNGLYYGLAGIVSALGFFFIISYFIAPRMGEFIHHFSIAESMGSIFGKYVRVITALSGMLYSVGSVAIQLNIISKVIKLYCKTDGNIPIYIAIGVVLVYSTFGGIKAITFTDVIQFITFSTLIPVLIYLVSTHIHSYKPVLTLLTTHPNFDLRQVIGLHPKFINTLILTFIFFFPIPQPSVMQRMYMAKNVYQVRSSFNYTIIISIVLKTIVLFLVIALLAHSETLNPKELLEYILKVHNYLWLKIFVCVGVLSLAMSTADSNLHVASVLFTHDIVTVFKWKPKNKLIVAHICSVLVTLLATWLFSVEKDLLNLILHTFSFYKPIVSVPFMMAIFGFRPSSKSVLLGMAAGAFTILAFKMRWITCLNSQYDVFPAILMNFLFLVGSYYLLPKVAGTGWVGIKDDTPLRLAKQNKTHKSIAFKKALKDFSLPHYLEKLLPTDHKSFFALGLYGLITAFMQLVGGQSNLLVPIVFMGFSSSIAIYPIIKDRISIYRHIVAYLYPLFIFILLFLSSSYMLSCYGYRMLVVQLFLTNIAVALWFLPWQVVVAMVAITLTMMHSMAPINLIELVVNGKCFFILLFFIALYIIILSWKLRFQRLDLNLLCLNQEKAVDQVTKLKRMQSHHYANQLAYGGSYEDTIIPEITDELAIVTQHSNLSAAEKKQLAKLIDRLHGYKQFVEELLYNRAYHLPLTQQTVVIQEVIHNIIQRLAMIDSQVAVVVNQQTAHTTLCADPTILEELFKKGIQYIIDSPGVDALEPIYLHIMDTSIHYSLNTTGTFNKILPALAFILTTQQGTPFIESVYRETLDNRVNIAAQNTHELDKHTILRIVEAHYGCFFIAERSSLLTLYHILPLDLNEIRDEVMNSLPYVPDLTFAETVESIAQEQSLTKLLVQESCLTQAQVTHTLQFIKYCHGNQRRDSGEPYYIHPMAVAELLLEETKDPAAILAALLHDVVEDSPLFSSCIKSRYGSEVEALVATVTHMGSSFRKKKLSKKEAEEQLRRCKDIRAIQIKIADRLHNVLTLEHRPIEKQVKVARQTLDFYIPFAESVGITTLTKLLRMRCEEILHRYEKAK